MAESRKSSGRARSVVRIQVREGITLENLANLIERVVGPQGCRTCGLGGFDLAFVVDPERLVNVKELAGAPGFEGVTVSAG